MATENLDFQVLDLNKLVWPVGFAIPSTRFRLLVAAESDGIDADVIARFAQQALSSGMVYCCAWGKGCERFHDIVDNVKLLDEIADRRFVGPSPDDVVMTTWHSEETLEEALEFFSTSAAPSEGYHSGSAYWIVMTLASPEWSLAAKSFLTRTKLIP